LNHTIFALKSGFFIFLISKLTFAQSFLVNRETILSLFSPVLPKIRIDLAVYTTISKLSWFLATNTSQTGIPVSSLSKISLALISSPKESL